MELLPGTFTIEQLREDWTGEEWKWRSVQDWCDLKRHLQVVVLLKFHANVKNAFTSLQKIWYAPAVRPKSHNLTTWNTLAAQQSKRNVLLFCAGGHRHARVTFCFNLHIQNLLNVTWCNWTAIQVYKEVIEINDWATAGRNNIFFASLHISTNEN